MSRFGPTRGELRFRLAASIAGLALMLVALFHEGAPSGSAVVEIVGLAGAFFGGTALWSVWQLARRDRE